MTWDLAASVSCAPPGLGQRPTLTVPPLCAELNLLDNNYGGVEDNNKMRMVYDGGRVRTDIF